MELPIKRKMKSKKTGDIVEVVNGDSCRLILQAYKMLHEQRRGANINRNINVNIDKQVNNPGLKTAEAMDEEITKLDEKIKEIEASFVRIDDNEGIPDNIEHSESRSGTDEETEVSTPEGEG